MLFATMLMLAADPATADAAAKPKPDALRAQQWAARLPVSLEPLAAWSLDGNAELALNTTAGMEEPAGAVDDDLLPRN